MILYALYVDAIFFPCHPYIWSTTVLHDTRTHVFMHAHVQVSCHVLGRLLTSERCEGVAEVELLLLCRGGQVEELLVECAQGQHLQECVYSMCVLFDTMYH